MMRRCTASCPSWLRCIRSPPKRWGVSSQSAVISGAWYASASALIAACSRIMCERVVQPTVPSRHCANRLMFCEGRMLTTNARAERLCDAMSSRSIAAISPLSSSVSVWAPAGVREVCVSRGRVGSARTAHVGHVLDRHVARVERDESANASGSKRRPHSSDGAAVVRVRAVGSPQREVREASE